MEERERAKLPPPEPADEHEVEYHPADEPGVDEQAEMPQLGCSDDELDELVDDDGDYEPTSPGGEDFETGFGLHDDVDAEDAVDAEENDPGQFGMDVD